MRKLIFILIFVLYNPIGVSAQGPSILPSDSAYNADTWNGSTLAPTQNSIRDKIVSMEAAALANPMDSAGDIIIGGALGVPAKLDAGTQNYLLQANGAGAPSWVTNINIGDITVGGGNINTGNIPLIIGDNTTDSITLRTDGGDVTVPEGTITLLDTTTADSTYQPLDSNLTLFAAGVNSQYDNPLDQPPSVPIGGRDYIEDCINWDSASLSIDKTGSSDIDFDAETKTISGAGSNDGYAANMKLRVVSGSSLNVGSYTIASVGATTIVVNETLVDEENQSAVLYGGYPYKVRYNDVTTSYVLLDNIKGDTYISGFDSGTILTVDGTYSGTTITMTVDSGVGSTSFGQAYHVDTDGELIDADADATTTAPSIGLAVESGTGLKLILLNGMICKTDWNWTVGGVIYLSTDPATTEGLSQTAVSGSGDQGQVLGVALSADTILFNPSFNLVEVP